MARGRSTLIDDAPVVCSRPRIPGRRAFSCIDGRYDDDVTDPVVDPLCSWSVDRSCLPVAENELDIAKQTAAEEMAIQVLWSLSGRQFGVCPVIVRPCPQPGFCDARFPYPYDSIAPFYPLWDGHSWRNVSCGCSGYCDWNAPSVIHLSTTTGLPIQEVLEVKFGADVLDEDQYVLEGELLYRTDGTAWPSQNLTLPLGSDGTWSITYTRGNPVPAGVGVLVGILAKEFLSACSGGKCRLPRRVRSITRQGVSMDMMDPTSIYAEGITGLPECDLWIKSVNPHQLVQPAKVR